MAVKTFKAPRRRGLGRTRLLVQLPSVVAGAALLVVAAGPWAMWALVVWLLGGLATASRAGERLTLRGRGFRPLNGLQRMQLQPVAAAALAQTGMVPGEIDWYVLHSRDPNAFAAGRRAVAVSTGLLGEHSSGRLSDAMVRAVVVHELGHHATSATRYALAVQWLAAPWRIWSRFVLGVCVGFAGRRQPARLLALVVAAGVVIAVVQAVQRGDVVTAAVLCVVTSCLLAVPVLEAALSRRGEWAADRFAAQAGAGYELARALETLHGQGGVHRRPTLVDRVLARHPEPDERITALLMPAMTPSRDRCAWR